MTRRAAAMRPSNRIDLAGCPPVGSNGITIATDAEAAALGPRAFLDALREFEANPPELGILIPTEKSPVLRWVATTTNKRRLSVYARSYADAAVLMLDALEDGENLVGVPYREALSAAKIVFQDWGAK